MRCERAQTLYEDYTRESLPVATMARVEEHLAGCPACREYYDQSDRIAALLRESSEVAHPGPTYFDDLAARVAGRLDLAESEAESAEPVVQEIPFETWRRPLWWAGAAGVAALLALAILPERPHPGDLTAARRAIQPPAVQIAKAEINPTATPTVIETLGTSGDPAKRELFIPPVDGEDELGEVEIAAAPKSQNGLVTLYKSLAGRAHGGGDVGGLTVPSSGVAPKSDFDSGKSPQPVKRAKTVESELKTVSLKKRAEPEDALPTEIIRQLQAMETQIATQGDEDQAAVFRKLKETIQQQLTAPGDRATRPHIKQASLYLQGDEALRQMRPAEAWSYYRRVADLDAKSPLATRATLQMADLYYGEWADFRQALEDYRLCRGPAAQEALTPAEQDHVARQLDRLQAYSQNEWEPLRCLYVFRRGEWQEALTALRQLTSIPGTAPLMPETARTIVERMQKAAPAAPPDVTIEIYKLLANQAQMEQNVEIRAWLELALGDLMIGQFNNPTQAVERYRRVIAASADSLAAKTARVKLDQLIEQSLRSDRVRK